MKRTQTPARKRKLSRLRKPEELSLEAWQIALRREFGREQRYRLKNVGPAPVFSEFEVTNPASKRTYRVAIRGSALGENYCSCPDFAVNTLGTCKHVEFVLARLGRRPGVKAKLALGYQPPFSEVYVQYGAQRQVVFRPGTKCRPELRKLAERYFDDLNRLKPEAYAHLPAFLQQASAAGHEVRCYDDTLAFVGEVRDRALLGARIAQAFLRGPRSGAWKNLLKVELYPYQREGALFAAKAGRCLIADDMGLGKTIQAIAAAEILARYAGIERVLIVCPTSLKHQWQSEIAKFTDRTTVVVEGLSPRRAGLYAAESFFKITNYDVVGRDLAAIERWRPDLVVLDEAQRIKNWKTRTAQSVKRLPSQFAIVLTGTPLENRLEELYSIVEFVDRFRLGPMFRFLDEHQHVDETGRVVGYRNLSHIARSLEDVLVRRTKEKVLGELPERLEKRFFVPMTPEQMTYHEENREIVARIVQKWRRYGFLSEADQLRLQIALQTMRMSCNSTYLVDKQTDFGTKVPEVLALLGEMLEDPQTKIVVFSQWLRMHELIASQLTAKQWGHVLFHGGVPGPQRKDLVRRFKEDPQCRLFLATDAGGVGLNLQNASAVLNLDQPWNPAVLEQRIGRVHRLGQRRPVRVVHFIAQGTIEESMLGLLAFKKSMFSGVLDGGQDEVFMGGTRLKRFMESVEKATGDIPPPAPSDATAPAERPDEVDGRAAPAAKPRRDAEQPPRADRSQELWSEVLSAGVSLLGKLAQAVQPGEGQSGSTSEQVMSAAAKFVARDDKTGQPYLRLPMPGPALMQRALDLLREFVGR